jgi:hypothetical protein
MVAVQSPMSRLVRKLAARRFEQVYKTASTVVVAGDVCGQSVVEIVAAREIGLIAEKLRGVEELIG